MEVTLVGDAGVEANTRAWECETGEEDDAREGGVGGGGLGGDDAPWLRRGDAGAPRDVAVVFEARLAGELRLESGSRVNFSAVARWRFRRARGRGSSDGGWCSRRRRRRRRGWRRGTGVVEGPWGMGIRRGARP